MKWSADRRPPDGIIACMPGENLVEGDRVWLQHRTNPEWKIAATFIRWGYGVGTAMILPDEELNSPANWIVANKVAS